MNFQNSIALMNQYANMLPEVYQRGSATAVFETDPRLVQAAKNGNGVVLPVMTTDGLADYGRNSGYVARKTKLEYKTYTFDYDRGGKFSVDSMDNEETDGIAFGSLASEFTRTQAIPELDAYRFAKAASIQGIFKKQETLPGPEETMSAIRTAVAAQDNAEVSNENRFLFITPGLLNAIEALDSNKSRKVLDRFKQIIPVPQRRFKTAIDLLDGETENELEGGFVPAKGASDINFMIIEKSAVIQHTKIFTPKVIDPQANQSADAWLFFFRSYGIFDIIYQKRAGVYMSYAPAST